MDLDIETLRKLSIENVFKESYKGFIGLQDYK